MLYSGQARQKTAVPGITIRGTVALLIATTTIPIIVTTTTVFVLSAVLRVLFRARAGKWEFVGRAKKESRPVPAML